MILALLTAAAASVVGMEANECHTQQVARYAATAEPADVVVRAVREACRAEERIVEEAIFTAFRERHPTAKAVEIRKMIERTLNSGYGGKLLKMVMDARVPEAP